jgi:antitoxin (DNA-binding transcriptional repressor) of toxin-antitoxin stability system
MHHMKTATVRDLRYSFSRVSQWIRDGEDVRITFQGQPFATLSPANLKKPAPIEWPNFKSRREQLFPKGVKGKSMSEIISEGRGDR